MVEIRSVSIRSVARLLALLATVCYLAVGAAVTLLYAGFRTIFGTGTFGVELGTFSFFLLWLAGTVVVVLVAYLLGLLAGLLYNAFSRWWGGIRCELVKVAGEVADDERAERKEEHEEDKKEESKKA